VPSQSLLTFQSSTFSTSRLPEAKVNSTVDFACSACTGLKFKNKALGQSSEEDEAKTFRAILYLTLTLKEPKKRKRTEENAVQAMKMQKVFLDDLNKTIS
jgi:hypothetical protein